MECTTNNLPPKLQAFASLLDAQPPEVQEAFQFLLATAMHEAGKFELLNIVEVIELSTQEKSHLRQPHRWLFVCAKGVIFTQDSR